MMIYLNNNLVCISLCIMTYSSDEAKPWVWMKVLKITYIFKTSAKFHKLVHFRAILSLVQKSDVIQQECYFDTLLATFSH